MNDCINESIHDEMLAMGRCARTAAARLARTGPADKTAALHAMASLIEERCESILEANALDVTTGRDRGLSGAMLDRLALDRSRVRAMADAVASVAEFDDPIGSVMANWDRPNGLSMSRVRVPLGVIGIVYESRPNVTADAAALCLKSGNAVILRGGSESFRSSGAIHAAIVDALRQSGIPEDAVQMVQTTDRAAVGAMLSGLDGTVDVIVPRGGRNLIERVQSDARVPVIGHLEGLCHVYVDASARPQMAKRVVLDAKLRRVGICGAAETLLIDRQAPATLVRDVIGALLDGGCEVRADKTLVGIDERCVAATPEDFSTEYLAPIISAASVDGVDGAAEHIARFGSGHTEAVIAEDHQAAERFLANVDSAIVLHNASTQFADGGEFGMGAEIGISTGKLHARGPVGVEQLTSYKYVVRGNGQTRG